MTDSTPIWRKRDDERTYQYEEFMDYAKLGPKRSLAALLEQYVRQEDGAGAVKLPTLNLRTLERWSSKYDWVKRAEAYDQHMISVEQEEREEQARALIRHEFDDYEIQLARWQDAWESTPYHEQDVVRDVDDPQRPGQKMRVMIVRSNVSKMLRLTKWRKDISDQGRRALNLPDRITEQRQQHSGKIEGGLSWKAFLEEVDRQNQALKDQAEAQGNDAPEWEQPMPDAPLLRNACESVTGGNGGHEHRPRRSVVVLTVSVTKGQGDVVRICTPADPVPV